MTSDHRKRARTSGCFKCVFTCIFITRLSNLLGKPAAKTADLILIMLDATKSEEQKRLLEIELDAVGIRLNKKKPDVVFKKRTTGGVSVLNLLIF